MTSADRDLNDRVDERVIDRLREARSNPRVASVYVHAVGEQRWNRITTDAWVTTLQQVETVALRATDGTYTVWYRWHDGGWLAADQSPISTETTFQATRANISLKAPHQDWTLEPVPIEATPFPEVGSGV